jgi:hypothetical protein
MRKLIGITAIAMTMTGGLAIAQQTAPTPAPGSGHATPQSMMCPMMGGMMGGGMMGGGMMSGGMMSGAQSESPRMLQMRGEMMKAMGEVMVKYGKQMETAK